MNYNKVLLSGNLTRDPEIKFVNDKPVCEFGLATNRKYKTASGEEREEVMFVDCEAWGRTAEVINDHLTKGKPIFIEGRLKLDQWEAQDGTKRSKHRVVVDFFQFVGGRDDGNPAPARNPPQVQAGAQRQTQRRPATNKPADAGARYQPEPDERPMQDEDIPF